MERLEKEMNQAEEKAWDSLSRYKFLMFGYWAGVWVHLNKIGDFRRPNPFRSLVEVAHDKRMQKLILNMLSHEAPAVVV